MPGTMPPLSPEEETTLRRIVLGIPKPEALRAADILRLSSLSLIEERSGRLAPTEVGMEKYRSQTKVVVPVVMPAPKALKRPGDRGRGTPFFGLR